MVSRFFDVSWRKTRIAANDNVRFISKPLGGGQNGKQILGLVALVAVSAFAVWAGRRWLAPWASLAPQRRSLVALPPPASHSAVHC